MRNVRVRCDVKGTARRARHRWHGAGRMRTAGEVCMLVKLDDMANKQNVSVHFDNIQRGGFGKQQNQGILALK